MGRYKDYYIEMHSLDWDIQNSACMNCPYHECQYYYNDNTCPRNGDELE